MCVSYCCLWRVSWTPKLRNSGPVSQAAVPVPTPTAPRRGLGRVWRQLPGRGSEASSRSANTWCPPARGPACPGREAAPGRPDWTGRDAGGAATSKHRRIPGRPAQGRGGGAPKTSRAPPPTGLCGLLQVPRRWPQAQAWGASQVPTTPFSHSSNLPACA